MNERLRLGQYSRYSRARHNQDIYSFCLFMDATWETLRNIEEVSYTLHPTFPDPIRRRTNPEDCFALQSEAWGVFSSTFEVEWKDGSITTFEYELDLKPNSWPIGDRLNRFQSQKEERAYMALFDEKFEWRKLSTVAKYASLELDEAEAILHSLEERKAVRKAYFQSIDKQDLWGSTSIVGLLPEPRRLHR
jgi:transcription initiation factor IIF auxiliary subunit